MTFPATALFGIVDCCPRTGRSAQVGPKVDALAKPLIAVSTKVDLEDLAGLIADRSGSRYALEALGVTVKRAIGADFAKKPGAEFFSHPRKRTKKVAIGMLTEEFLYLRAIGFELTMEGTQHASSS